MYINSTQPILDKNITRLQVVGSIGVYLLKYILFENGNYILDNYSLSTSNPHLFLKSITIISDSITTLK